MTGEVLGVLARRGTPPGQGGVEYLQGMIVDIPSTMQLVFQQSKSYVYCAAIQFLDRVPDIPVVLQKRDSTVQSLNKVVDAGVYSVAHAPDSAAVAFTDKVVDISVLAFRSGGASDSVID